MQIDSKYSIEFYSDKTNKEKNALFRNKAFLIRSFKNELSEKVWNSPSFVVNLSEDDFLKKFNCQIEGLVGREIQPAISDVFVKYKTKADKFKLNIKFKLQNEFVIKYYQKKTKKFKRGDFKESYLTTKETSLTKAMSFIAKYYNDGLAEYLKQEINNEKTTKTESQIVLYKSALHYINKFGDRLMNLIHLKIANTQRESFFKPILFKKLTYTAINNLKEIVAENKNKNSEITHFMSFSGFIGLTEEKILHIPFKYSEKYHGDLSEFNKNQPTYTVKCINDDVRITLTKKGFREYAEDKMNIVGVDINLKHNLFSCSNGKDIDFDRELIKNFVKIVLRYSEMHDFLYKKEEKDLTKTEIKKRNKIIRRLDKWLRKLSGYYKLKASQLLKMMKEEGFDHLALEDLNLGDKSWCRSEEFYNIKYSSLVRILHLCDFKNIFSTQASKRNIQVTIIPSHYTSQMCSNPNCGFIHRDNRKTQELFKCIECGLELNADVNARINIRNIASSDVLREKLLQLDSNRWLTPKGQKKQTIKKILEEHFYLNNQKKIRSCGASQKEVGLGEEKVIDFTVFH